MKRKERDIKRNLSDAELAKDIDSMRKELAKAIIERYTKQPKNVKTVRNIRRRLSILLTIQKEKELVQESHA